MPFALSEDSARSARLVAPGSQAAPTHPGAPPEQLGGVPWSQELSPQAAPTMRILSTHHNQAAAQAEKEQRFPKLKEEFKRVRPSLDLLPDRSLLFGLASSSPQSPSSSPQSPPRQVKALRAELEREVRLRDAREDECLQAR